MVVTTRFLLFSIALVSLSFVSRKTSVMSRPPLVFHVPLCQQTGHYITMVVQRSCMHTVFLDTDYVIKDLCTLAPPGGRIPF